MTDHKKCRSESDPRKVYFNGNFWRHHGREHAGREIPVDTQFSWGDEKWRIPVVYVCGKGLVVDFCVGVEQERIRAFMDKYDLWRGERQDYDEDERDKMISEHPLNVDVSFAARINGKTAMQSRGCGVSWIPCLPDGMEPDREATVLVEQYGLDKSMGWSIKRATFPWATKGKPRNISSLELTLSIDPAKLTGISFNTPAPGESVRFIHPVTGIEHTLTVHESEKRKLDIERLDFDIMDYPTHYTLMTYTLSPELPNSAFAVRDSAKSDSPRQREINELTLSKTQTAVTIGIIGGEDGPTAILYGKASAEGKLHTACSALHFEPADTVLWQVLFYEKMRDDMKVTLF